MYPLKQSSAITLVFFVHDANGDGVTGLSDGSFTKRISKGSGAFAAMTVTITEMENGFYSIPLTATHSDTLGLLTISFSNASAQRTNLQYRVHVRIPDDLAFPNTTGRGMDVLATGEVGIDLDNVNGALGTSDFDADFLTNALLADNVIAAEQIAAGAITSSEAPNLDVAVSTRSDFDETTDPVELLDSGGAAGTSADELVNDIWDEPKAGHVGAGSFGEEVQLHALSTEISALNNISAGDVWDEAKAGHVGAGSFGEEVQAHALSTEISALNDLAQSDILDDATPFSGGSIALILADTNELQTDDVPGLIAALNDLSAAQVNTEVDTALVDARLDELISATAGGVDATIGSFLDLIMNADGGQTFSQATDSLEALAGASAPSAAVIAAAVWDEAKAGHVAGGSFGEEVQLHALSTEISALNDLAVTDILADSVAFNGANIDVAISSRAVAGDAMTLAAGAIVAATFGAGAIDAAALATDAGQEIADRILLRSLATGADGGRTVQEALRLLRNRRAVAGGTLTVYEEDDVTPDWTAAVTTAAGDPVDEIDPA